MKFREVLVVLFMVLSVISCNSEKPESKVDKYSYAIGQQVGSSIQRSGMEFNADVFHSAMKDALKGDSSMSQQEIMMAVNSFRMEASKLSREKEQKNIKEGEDFLEKNKSKDGVKVTASGLQYKVITEGKGQNPQSTDKVKVHYRGTLINGSEFDSSYKRNKPAVFPLNQVIKGWTEGMQLMKIGAKYEFYIPANLAYGPMERDGIPRNSALIFEVELLDIVK